MSPWRAAAIALLLASDLCAAQQSAPPSAIAALIAKDGNTSVHQFYQDRQFALAWSGTAAADANARRIVAALAHAAEDGLDPSRYEISASADPAARDVALTKSALAYMKELHGGRADLKSLDRDVALPTAPYDAAGALGTALREDRLQQLLAGLAPSHPQYAQLKSALARYRAIAAQGGWPMLPPATPEEFSHALAPLLRERLRWEDKTLASAPQDADIAPAVVRFQQRHGLTADGVIGRQTLAALNRSAASQADTIKANMERWRWLPRTLEVDRIMINAADAELQLWLKDAPLLRSRVIVGRPRDPTPILRADGAGVTVNPPWTVPASIAAHEILPKLKANPAYLAANDMILLNGPSGDPHGLHINWRAIRPGTFPYQIRQYPGPRNPLGRIKFELPNRFDVYLHDTPGKASFAQSGRALSHGCVRVEQILPLASYALAADLSASDKIVDAIAAGQTKYLPLPKRLPVYFLYWTAFTGTDGEIEFRPDLYGRDQRLIAAMRTEGLRLAGDMTTCGKA